MSWLLARSELTAEQLRAVEMPPTENRLILGGPGSGKTQVLLHRAAFLRDRDHVAPDRFHIFAFTNTLKNYIRSALDLLNLPGRSVATFDSWCREYHTRWIGPVPTRTVQSRRGSRQEPDFAAIRHAVAQWVRRERPAPVFEFVLVDEGQDLDEEAFGLLSAVSRHVTVCMDRKQRIYSSGADEQGILRQLRLRHRNVALLDALRCSPYVTAVAVALVDDPEEGRQFQKQTRTIQMERETPLLYYSKGFEDERQRLISVLQVRQRRGDRVAILLPQRWQVAGFARGLAEDGLSVEALKDVDFNSDAPKLLTYHSAKGLTFDTVLMPRLVPRSFPGSDRLEIERLLFVGVSRAVKWVYFSTDEHVDFPPIERVLTLAAKGGLTVQGSRAQADLFEPAAATLASPSLTPPSPNSADDDDVLDIL